MVKSSNSNVVISNFSTHSGFLLHLLYYETSYLTLTSSFGLITMVHILHTVSHEPDPTSCPVRIPTYLFFKNFPFLVSQT